MKKLLCLVNAFFIMLCLCGCDFFSANTAELLSPPALSGDMYPISEAIKKSIKTEYTLEYPSRGNYRSAVIQQDIDKDGILEAFAFYSTTENEIASMHINAVVKKDGEWTCVAEQNIVAGGVDRIDFSDLDHDGREEILVGWEIYGTSDLQLAIYSFDGNELKQIMLEPYTHFISCDLDENDHNEVFIVRSNPAESSNTAHLFSVKDEGVVQTAFCELDGTSKTLNHPIAAPLSTGQPAIYIDEIKGVGAVTEVLFLKNGELVNPLFSVKRNETVKTLRLASLETTDINQDGIPEIPVQSEVPTVNKVGFDEKLYLTNWCSFTGETLTNQLTALVNQGDGYYYSIPQKWIGNIALLKDTDNSLIEIYRYYPKNDTAGERLMYFRAVKKQDWDSGMYKKQDVEEIVNNGETSYICYISPTAVNDGIDIEKVKSDFKLY